MSVSKQRALLKVELYQLSGNFIHELREGQKDPKRVWELLPTYTSNTNEGQHNQPRFAESYHQFIGIIKEQRDEKYLYFNLTTDDADLNEEIGNAGIEDLFEEFDFKKTLSVFKPHSGDEIMKFIFPTSNYLVIEITYDTFYDYYEGTYEGDVYIDIIGYLNSDLEIKYFTDESIRVKKKVQV